MGSRHETFISAINEVGYGRKDFHTCPSQVFVYVRFRIWILLYLRKLFVRSRSVFRQPLSCGTRSRPVAILARVSGSPPTLLACVLEAQSHRSFPEKPCGSQQWIVLTCVPNMLPLAQVGHGVADRQRSKSGVEWWQTRWLSSKRVVSNRRIAT